MKLGLLRHLPTGFNQAGLIQGRRDEPILAPGPEWTEEIARTRHRLEQGPGFEQVLVSRLRRTAMTAGEYGYTNTQVEPLLDELDFGQFEGVPRSQMLEALGQNWFDNPQQLRLGETIVDLEARIDLFLTRYAGIESVLAFGHGTWIRACVSKLRHGHVNLMNQMHIANNELVLLQF